MSRRGVLAAGNWIVDHVKQIDAYPEQDALAFISSQQSSNGGGPYNVLKNLAKLGADFPLAGAGLVGDDTDGRWILGDCASHGIDTEGIGRTGAAPTSFTDVMSVTADGRRTFFHQVGANALFDGAGIDFGRSRARFFYLGYLMLLDALDRRAGGSTGASRLLARARSAGLETVVDLVSAQTGDAAKIVPPALPETDTLFLNEREAGALLGRPVDPGGLLEAARDVLALGVRRRVVAHCAQGAVLADVSGASATQGSVRVPAGEIAGAAGAGDAFAAGFLLALHDGRGDGECLRWGVSSAAASLTDPTTSGGVVPMPDALARAASLGFLKPLADGP